MQQTVSQAIHLATASEMMRTNYNVRDASMWSRVEAKANFLACTGATLSEVNAGDARQPTPAASEPSIAATPEVIAAPAAAVATPVGTLSKKERVQRRRGLAKRFSLREIGRAHV